MAESKRSWLKYGCMGCAGVVLLPTLIFAVLLGIGLATGRGDERVEPLERSQPIPAAPVGQAVEVAEPGRIVLDLNRGRFAIRSGPAGEPIRLEGRYDAGRYVLSESFEGGEVGWIYRLGLDQKGFGIRPFIQHGDPENDLQLIVPRDVPVVLEGSVGLAETEFELGGLWIVELDLEMGIGSHRLRFDEPQPVPMRRFRLDHSAGELRIGPLGNPSPATVEITRSIGDMRLDLQGPWRNDSSINVSCGIGECCVKVPDDVGVELERGGIMIGETHLRGLRDRRIEGAPTLQLSVSGKLGELRFN